MKVGDMVGYTEQLMNGVPIGPNYGKVYSVSGEEVRLIWPNGYGSSLIHCYHLSFLDPMEAKIRSKSFTNEPYFTR